MKELDIEVTSQEIFEKMKNNTFHFFNNYPNFSINKDYLNLRNSIFKILYKITIQLGFKSQTYFLSTHYLDIILSKGKKISSNMYKLGLAALCLSAKFCENDPAVPPLKYFIKFYNNIAGYKNIISMNYLRYNEVLVCKLLNYKLSYYTIYDYNIYFFSHGLLKFDQLLEIEKDVSYKNNINGYSITPHLIKNILCKIYKKSRYFLEEIIKIYEICIKYDPLFISIIIMKKSIEEILAKEYNINKFDNEYKIKFYKKNDLFFKEIMNDYYKFDYERNEQYKQLIDDPEIQNIFLHKENKERKENINRNYSRPHRLAMSKEKNDISKKNIMLDSNTIFANSVSSGFYKKLMLKNSKDFNNTNNNTVKNTLTIRKINNIDPSIDYLGDIKTYNISGRIKDNINEIDICKSHYNFNNKKKKNFEKHDMYSHNVSSVKSHKNSINRLNTFNNLHVNSINSIDYSMKINYNKYNVINENSEKKSTIKFENIEPNKNSNKYVKFNKYIQNIKINYLYENDNKLINLDSIKLTNNTTNSDYYNQNKERKTYIKKSIIMNGKDPFNSSKKNLSKASTLNSFYYNKNHHNINNNNKSTKSATIDNNITNSLIKNSNNIFKKRNLHNEQMKTKQNSENILIINEGNYIDNEFNIENYNNKKDLSLQNKNSSKTKTKYINNIVKNDTTSKEIIIEDQNHSFSNRKKTTKNKKYATSEQFYPKNKKKICVNTTKATEFKNGDNNIKTDRVRLIPYLLSQKNSEINNLLKEINETYAKNKNKEKNFIHKNSFKKNEITVNILNKNNDLNKYRKFNLNRTKSKNIKDAHIVDKQINFIKNGNNDSKLQSSTNISNKNNINTKMNNMNSIRHKFLYKNDINSNNNTNKNILVTNKSEMNSVEKNKEPKPSSSIYQLLNKAKLIFPKKNKEENEKKNVPENNILTNLNFFKSQKNFYNNKYMRKSKEKKSNIKNYNESKNKIIINKCNDSKHKRNSCFKNQININKLNIENFNCENQKNSTIIINNTININIENKAKKIHKPNNIPKLNINDIVLNTNKNYEFENKTSTNRNINNNLNSSTNRTDNAKEILNRLFNKFPLNKKKINKNKY